MNAIAAVFRDEADRDYVIARQSYRLMFRQQFLWSALQAAEKYFKAILLFNEQSARRETPRSKPDYGHDLRRLFAAIRGIRGLDVQCPAWSDEFVAYLSEYGNNRYVTRFSYTRGLELRKLDEFVWCVRRYCQCIRGCIGKQSAMKTPEEWMRIWLTGINHPANRAKPCSFRPILSGALERILEGPASSLDRQALIWKNHFFGSKNRARVTYSSLSGSVIPPNLRTWCRDPKLLSALGAYVQF